jgi:hypothetical protein
VFNAICAGFYSTPKYCMKYLDTNDVNKDDLVLMTSGKGFHTYIKVGKIVAGMMVLFCLMLLCYRRSAKRAMK